MVLSFSWSCWWCRWWRCYGVDFIIHLHFLSSWKLGIFTCQLFLFPHMESEADSWQAVGSAHLLPMLIAPVLEGLVVAAGMLLRQSQVLHVVVGGDGDDGLYHLVQDPFLDMHVVVLDSVCSVPRILDLATHNDVKWDGNDVAALPVRVQFVGGCEVDIYVSLEVGHVNSRNYHELAVGSSAWGSFEVAPLPEPWHQTCPLPQPL